MKLKLDVYGGICETKTFVINGVKATYKDFGEKYDTSPDKLKPKICGNMVFKPKYPTKQILEKYRINIDEYSYICQQLHDSISFGTCRQCS